MAQQNEGRAALTSRRPSGCLSRQNDNSSIAPRPIHANGKPFLFDSQGFVIAFVSGRAEARALMREGV